MRCSGRSADQPRREERTEGACLSVPSLLSLQPVRALLEDRERGLTSHFHAEKKQPELVCRLEVVAPGRRYSEVERSGSPAEERRLRIGGDRGSRCPAGAPEHRPASSRPRQPSRAGVRAQLTVSGVFLVRCGWLAALAAVAGAPLTAPPAFHVQAVVATHLVSSHACTQAHGAIHHSREASAGSLLHFRLLAVLPCAAALRK